MECSRCGKHLPDSYEFRKCRKCRRYFKRYMQQRRSKSRDQESQSSSIEPETKPTPQSDPKAFQKMIMKGLEPKWEKEKEERSQQKSSIETDSYDPMRLDSRLFQIRDQCSDQEEYSYELQGIGIVPGHVLWKQACIIAEEEWGS